MADRSTAPFDPYHKWLGIPPSEHPADHYRLLGIAPRESDPDVIAIAADRQMAHVKSFVAGPHAADSQKLLAELSRARICLLNPTSKQAYDDGLRGATTTPRGGGPASRTGQSRPTAEHPPVGNREEQPVRTVALAPNGPAVAAPSGNEPMQPGANVGPVERGIAIRADWATARVAGRRRTAQPARWAIGLLVVILALVGPVGSYMLLRRQPYPPRPAGTPSQRPKGGAGPLSRTPSKSRTLTTARNDDAADSARDIAEDNDRPPEPTDRRRPPIAEPVPPRRSLADLQGDQRQRPALATGSFRLDLSRRETVAELDADLPHDAVVTIEAVKGLDTPYAMLPTAGTLRENQPLDIELTEFRTVFKQATIRLSLKRRDEVTQISAVPRIDAGLKAPVDLTNSGQQRLRRLASAQSKRLLQQFGAAQTRRAQIQATFASRRMLPLATRKALVAELRLLNQQIPALESGCAVAQRNSAAVDQLCRIATQTGGKTEIVYRIDLAEP